MKIFFSVVGIIVGVPVIIYILGVTTQNPLLVGILLSSSPTQVVLVDIVILSITAGIILFKKNETNLSGQDSRFSNSTKWLFLISLVTCVATIIYSIYFQK